MGIAGRPSTCAVLSGIRWGLFVAAAMLLAGGLLGCRPDSGGPSETTQPSPEAVASRGQQPEYSTATRDMPASPSSTAFPTPIADFRPTPTSTPLPRPDQVPTLTTVPESALPLLLDELLPWYSSPPSDAHARAAFGLETIAFRNPEMVKAIAKLPWISDGVSGEEAYAIEALVSLAEGEGQLANLSMELPWVADGLNRIEAETLIDLAQIVSRDVTLAERILRYPWLSDSVTNSELNSVSGLADIASRDLELARRLAAESWVSDAEAPSSRQSEALENLGTIVGRDREMARRLGEMLSEDSGWWNIDLAGSLTSLIKSDPGVFDALASQSWYSDGLNDAEIAFLLTTRDIVEHSPRDYYAMLQSHHVRSARIDLPLSGSVNLWAIQKTPFPEGDYTIEVMVDALRSIEDLVGVPLPFNHIVVLIVVVEPDSDFEVSYSNLDTPWPGAGNNRKHVRIARKPPAQVNRDTLIHELSHYHFTIGPNPPNR